MSLAGKPLTSLSNLSDQDIQQIMDYARLLHSKQELCNMNGLRILGLFMAKSLRARLSFETAVNASHAQLSSLSQQEIWDMIAEEGSPMYSSNTEHCKDAAKSLSAYSDLIAIRHEPELNDFERVKDEPIINSFLNYASVPILNLGSAMHRPLHAIADTLAIEDNFHGLAGKKIAIHWTYHPQALSMASANSMLEIASRRGLHIHLAHPDRYALAPSLVKACSEQADNHGGSLSVTNNSTDALNNADVVFACSWGAKEFYGNWEQEKLIREKLKNWSISAAEMRLTKDARFLYPLPVRRNISASDEVIDAHYSLVYDQITYLQAVQQASLALILNPYRNASI